MAALRADPELHKLIASAVENNLDLQLATERLLEARALAKDLAGRCLAFGRVESPLSTSPRQLSRRQCPLGSRPGASSLISPYETNVFRAGFDASWELDLFGGKTQGSPGSHSRSPGVGGVAARCPCQLVGRSGRQLRRAAGAQRRLAITMRNVSLQRDLLHSDTSARGCRPGQSARRRASAGAIGEQRGLAPTLEIQMKPDDSSPERFVGRASRRASSRTARRPGAANRAAASPHRAARRSIEEAARSRRADRDIAAALARVAQCQGSPRF